MNPPLPAPRRAAGGACMWGAILPAAPPPCWHGWKPLWRQRGKADMAETNHDLAVIGNGSIASLISKEGTHLWCCWPRLDGDPLFHGLVSTDAAAGHFSVRLEGQASATQRYLPNTAIVETILRDDFGNALRVVDFCPR